MLKNNNIKKIVLISFMLSVLICFCAAAPKPGYKFVASRTAGAKKFHTFDCRWAKQIKDECAVYFKTPEEATVSGYQPCKNCKPCPEVIKN